jgi:hypothetical protein
LYIGLIKKRHGQGQAVGILFPNLPKAPDVGSNAFGIQPYKMKLHFLIISIYLSLQLNAQIKVKNLDQSSLPKNVQFIGKMYKAVSWRDNSGNNIAILTNTGKIRSKNPPDNGYYDAALYAYHYIISGDSLKSSWRVYDFVKDCPLDLILNFIPNTFSLTDLDNNGFAEVWIMYKSACKGDVSPNSQKIIMYENNKKFALRGNSQVKVSENEIIGGDYKMDEAFKNGHPSFRKYAENLWNKHKVETWE